MKESGSHKETVFRYLQAAKTKREYQRALCIWLRISLSLTADEIGIALGMTPMAVRKFHSRFSKLGTAIFDKRHSGGRTWAYLDEERERKLMKTFLRQAQQGHSLDVKEIKRAYEQSAGREVSRSTIYRLIARHGMRRFLPEARAPRKNPMTIDSNNQENKQATALTGNAPVLEYARFHQNKRLAKDLNAGSASDPRMTREPPLSGNR